MAEQMKPSGIDWIGDIPESWYMIKLKYFSYLKGRIGWQGLTADEFIDEGPYLITGTDFENGKIQFDRSYHISDERYNQAPEIQLKVGDLLVTKDGTVGKMAYVDTLPGKASLNSHLLLIRPLENKFDNRFLFWLMSSSVFNGYTEYAQDGTVMASLSQEKIGNFIAYFPEITEQQAVADFLDKECAQIDSIAADLEKQIALLQQYKKSLITETVTKGLDKSVPMKDSGIEWIGEIPEHWKVYRIKNVLNILTDYTANGSFKDLADNVEYLDFESYARVIRLTDLRVNMQNYGIYVDEHAYNYLQKSALLGGETLIANVGAYAGLFCEMPTVQYKATLGPNMYMMITDPKLLLQHYFYLLGQSQSVCDQLQIKATASAQPKLNKMDVKSVYIAIPPVYEQYKISEFLDSKISVIDETIDMKYQQLEAIRQHKKSLIYEYVTGKKRVKEVR